MDQSLERPPTGHPPEIVKKPTLRETIIDKLMHNIRSRMRPPKSQVDQEIDRQQQTLLVEIPDASNSVETTSKMEGSGF